MITTITPDLISEITANGGFTYDPITDELITVGSTTGYAIAIPGTEHTVGTGAVSREQFASAVADIVWDHADEFGNGGAVLGGWYSADRDEYMIEISKIWNVAREFAIMMGRSTNQEAIFDLGTGEEIPTGGTGDATPVAPVGCVETDHAHCPLHGCVAYVCCAPVADAPASAWDAADAPATAWAAYLRANPIIGNLIF